MMSPVTVCRCAALKQHFQYSEDACGSSIAIVTVSNIEMWNSERAGEFVGDVAGTDCRVHGGEERGLLISGPRR